MNPRDYYYPSIVDLDLAVEKGYLTKVEVRAILLETFPSVRRLADAAALVVASETGD